MLITLQVIFCAFMLSLCIPSKIYLLGNPYIALVAFTPLYIALKSCRRYLTSGLCLALEVGLTHVLSSFWLGNFSGYVLFTLGASALGTAFIGFAMGLYAHYLLMPRTYPNTALAVGGTIDVLSDVLSPFKFCALMVVYEWAKSTGFLAYPWGTIYMSSYKWLALIQIADWGGVWLISFLLISSSTVVGEWVLAIGRLPGFKRHKDIMRLTALVLLSYIVALVYGGYRLCTTPPIRTTLNTVVIQNDADPWERHSLAQEEENILISMQLTQDALKTFSTAGKKADLVLWSEGVLRRRFPQNQRLYEMFPIDSPLLSFIADCNTPFIIGGSYEVDPVAKRGGNAALFFNSQGVLDSYYTKMHLVPFAEGIPFSEYPSVRRVVSNLTGMGGGWVPGTHPYVWDLPLISSGGKERVRFSVPICFEDAFYDVCAPLYWAGSEVFLNITNDAWSLEPSAEWQHLVLAAFRTIEYREAMVRACQSGVTVLLDSRARILKSLPLFKRGYLTLEVPIYERHLTFYALYGNWLPHILLALLIAYAVLERVKGIRGSHIFHYSIKR